VFSIVKRSKARLGFFYNSFAFLTNKVMVYPVECTGKVVAGGPSGFPQRFEGDLRAGFGAEILLGKGLGDLPNSPTLKYL
jgi:hypothetical protein